MSFSWKQRAIVVGCLAIGAAGAVIFAREPAPRLGIRSAGVGSDDAWVPLPVSTPASVNAAPQPVPPAAPTTPATAPPAAVATDADALVARLKAQGITTVRNVGVERANAAQVARSAAELAVAPTATVETAAANFVTYGSSSATVELGSGERLSVVRDLFDTLGATVQSDGEKLLTAAEQISSGQKPTVRNLARERAQANAALAAFRKLTGRSAPDFEDATDDLAWNTMLYRIRFPRDLAKEQRGITKFKATFKRTPRTPSDWAIVRAWAYALQ